MTGPALKDLAEFRKENTFFWDDLAIIKLPEFTRAETYGS